MDTTNRLVIGIDLGSCDSYVAHISKGAVDVVQNEVSQRKTPTLVGFTERERLLGDQALSQIKSNVRNTCRNFKHLLGLKLDSAAAQAEQFWATCDLTEDSNGYAGFSVNYKGEQVTFSAAAVTAMFLTKLKDITEAWCQGVVEDVVIGVPSYFSDFQRTALLDAAKIAGLRVLRIMNEHAATALEYGYFRTTNFDTDKPHTVAFCQMGHAVFSVAIVQFFKGRLTILCEKSAKVGGRDMDECLIRAFAEQFKKKSGCDVLSNKKALFKLEDAVTKTKKILSANSESGISCECLMEDEDFSSRIDRADFLEMCKPMMAKVHDVLEAAKAASGIRPSQVEVVEMCGGASRVPWVKEMCSKAFGGKELSMTMNADECVARGCAIQAAVLSPLYKARDFKIEDTSPFPVSLGWSHVSETTNLGGGESEMASVPSERSALVFPQNSLMNLTKVMTFFRKQSFELTATYSDGEALPPGVPKRLGSFKVELPEQQEKKKVKVKAALTVHGTFEITSAQLVEEEDVGAETGPERHDDAREDEAVNRRTTSFNGAGRRRCRRTDLTVTSVGRPGMPASALQRSREEEERMVAEMMEIVETNARRNDLESYVLTMRSGIDAGSKLGAYITDANRVTLAEQLGKAEEWLYDHPGEGKRVFIDKLAELKVLGAPVERRFRDDERRPEASASLERAAQQLKAAAKQVAGKPKYEPAHLKSLEKACDETVRWLTEMKAKQSMLPRHEDPILDCAAIQTRKQELIKLAESILGREGDGAEMSDGNTTPGVQDDAGNGMRTRSMDVD